MTNIKDEQFIYELDTSLLDERISNDPFFDAPLNLKFPIARILVTILTNTATSVNETGAISVNDTAMGIACGGVTSGKLRR